MSTASKRTFSSTVGNGPNAQAKVSAYDRASSLLIALLALVGLAVLLLLLFWLTTRVDPTRRTPNVVPFEFGERGGTRDLVEPGWKELNDVAQPQYSQTLRSITEAVSNVQAAVEAIEGQDSESGTGPDVGDPRITGPYEDDEDGPFEIQMVIHFSTIDKKTYFAQLDYFGIELGVIGGTRGVDYASKLSQAKPVTRRGSAKDEKRLYFIIHSKNTVLKKWNRELLKNSGIKTRGRIILQFVPDSVTKQLSDLQRKAAGNNRTLDDIRSTAFGVRRNGDKFEFYIIEQQYR